MTPTRLQTALDRVETRRVEIERQIISDLERQFSPTLSASDDVVTHVPLTEADTVTHNGSPFTFSWFGIG